MIDSNCFICLKPTTVGERESKDGSVIKSLFRYLEIDLEETEANEEEDEVDLCEKCGKHVRLIINQIELLEVAEMRIRYYLEEVKNVMTESDDKQTLISSRGSEVRDAIFGMCSMKTSNCQPHVRIDKLKIQPIQQESVVKEENEEVDVEAIDLEVAHDDFETPEEEAGEEVNLPATTKVKRFTCDQCKKGYTTKETLKVHMKAVHLKEKGYKCNLCERKFFHSSSFKHHLVICKGKPLTVGNFHCKICNKRFARKKLLNYHNKMVHLNIRNHICDICGKKFQTKSHLINHKRFLHEGHKVNCEVPGCGRSYASVGGWQKHLRLAHQMEPPSTSRLPGPATKLKYADKSEVVLEKEISVSIPKSTWICETCGKEFNSRQGMNLHINYNHANVCERKFVCEICGKGSFTKAGAEQHMNGVHLKVLKYSCKFPCTKKYPHKRSLNNHQTNCEIYKSLIPI